MRVLVIEDNPTNQELMTYLLTAFGHDVTTTDTGESGIEEARRLLPDLILCDLALPKLDGYGVVRELKRRPPTQHIPIVAVTASAMMSDRTAVLAAGFDGYITKPIVPETFVADVASFHRRNPSGDDPGR